MTAHEDDYPNTPGHRGVDTSMEAAEKVASIAPAIREKVLQGVAAAGAAGLTVLEGCQQFGWDRHGAQPRFTELKALGKIIDSGQRRRNPSGVRAIVWVTPDLQGSQSCGAVAGRAS